MIPARDDAHVAESVALLTDTYRNLKVIPGITSAYASEVQRLEGALWDVIAARALTLTSGPTGAHLDTLGKLVGEGRQGRGDVDYLSAVRIRIRANRSQGRAEDMLQIARLLHADYLLYDENYPAAFRLTLRGLVGVRGAAPILKSSRAAGVLADLVYTNAPSSSDFITDSVYGHLAYSTPCDDSYVPNTFPYLMGDVVTI